MNIDDLLMFVRKTNPTMTKEKLMQELKKSKYSTIACLGRRAAPFVIC